MVGYSAVPASRTRPHASDRGELDVEQRQGNPEFRRDYRFGGFVEMAGFTARQDDGKAMGGGRCRRGSWVSDDQSESE